MKKVLIILIVAFITIACNGQATLDAQRKEAIESFKKQKHRFEIKGYKIYYNDTLLKLEKRDVFYKKLGNPFYDGDVAVWNTIPMWADNYSTIDRFFIYFRPFFEGNRYFTPDIAGEKGVALKQMPVIDGYMLVEGIPIDKDITPQELKEALQPIYKGNYGVLMGTPTLIFKLKEKQIKEIIPHWGADKAYDNIFIGFEFIRDPKTKEVKGLKSVDYYNFMM
ncbi:hypothetical protein ABC973_11135 [Capnocytophaga sputigena]|uniref:hypothetical protein n=1 Tax=Capnocytophaga sputigena TaxID=1019 RepID=UPI0031F5D28B